METIAGHRRYLPDINHTSFDRRGGAERISVNTTVQGSAANLAKAALVKIEQELFREFPKRVPHQLATSGSRKDLSGGYLVLQLHDEFLFEVCERDLEKVAEIVERCMRTSMKLSVGLSVNLKVGPNWGSLKPYKLPSCQL